MATSNVERVELGALTCWRIRHADAELLVAQQGAQLLSYQRDGERPLIWLSEQAVYESGRSVRGGVPVCWPWFGDLRRNPQAVQAMYQGGNLVPSHGLVRDLEWNLLGIDRQGDGVNLEFAYNSAEQPLPGWPQAAELQLRIRLDQHLHLHLDSHNLGDQPLALSQALHSYFAVGDIRQTQVEGLQGCRYIDTLDDWNERQQLDALRFTGETDRIYLDSPSRLSILDPVWQRRIQLRSSGSRSAVLWNPWTDKAQRLSQFAGDAWQGMLCIEHANVLEDFLVLAPDARHRLSVSLWSEALPD
ncbi:D-hexose-6-phosphate mutarotase [Pseudomonas benzenivorans]|uniref:D-hexose-6-phosphate mutarotase n=1 Tax=Pseudomonas benzenivorans TaxID=556533 RepID=UPI0035159AC7